MRSTLTIAATIIITLPLLFIPFTCGVADRDPTARYSAAELLQDFRQLKNLIGAHHPGTFTDWAELNSAFARQALLLTDSMDVVEFHRIISPAVAKVRCGHTRLSLPEAVYAYLREHGNFLPFDIRAIGDSLFVYQSFTDAVAIARGSAVISIDGLPAAEIIARLKSCLWSDGVADGYKYCNINWSFRSRYLVSIAAPERFEIAFVEPGDVEVKEAVVAARGTNEIRRFRTEHGLDQPSPPTLEASYSRDETYALLTVRFFDYSDDQEEFDRALDGFFQRVADGGIGAVILDLRGNDGGNPYGAAYLLRHLIAKPFRYFTTASSRFYADLTDYQEPAENVFSGDLYVLVDGCCFSTTGHLCALLRHYKRGTFIGEETGGSYICNGAYQEVELDHTGINLLLPRTAFAVEVEGFQPGRPVIPDVEVLPTIDDLIADRDPALQAAIRLIDDHE